MAKHEQSPDLDEVTDAAADDALGEAIAGTVGQDQAAELAAANDRLLRLQAEMQNLRNRTSREIAD
jgi:molecular chaperone GrpE (heat shock protein)